MEMSKGGHVPGGALLVAGTAIGGGMLALPVLTAAGGFWPAIVIYLACWAFMTSTALLLVEIFLWSQDEVNLVSMAKMTLGTPGKIIAWILYLFLFYSLTVAYLSGGGSVALEVIEAITSHSLARWVGPFLFVLVFAPFVAVGAKAVDKLNVILMSGLILSFLIFIVIGLGKIDLQLLTHANWNYALLATPVVFTSFGFQGIVPTLTNYLDRKPLAVRNAILIGSVIPLLAYIVWEGLILGIIPQEALDAARAQGQSAVAPFKHLFQFPWLFRIGEFFAFFAIVTSFLGVTLGLLDFLADGLKIKKTLSGRLLLSLVIFGPPLAFAMINPCVFLNALHYAGGFGCALLLGLLPILMAWRGRYTLKYQGPSLLGGGRFVLTLLILFIVFELAVMLVKIF